MNRILELIVDFITSEMGYDKVDIEYHAGKDLARMCEWIKRFDKSLKAGWDKDDFKEFKECLRKLIEIRDIYQKGRVFVENSKRGYKKGYRSFTLKYLHFYLDKPKEAQKIAEKHLAWVRKWRSERTYYRHKKALREIGIEI